MTGADDIQYVGVSLANKAVKVGVDEDESGACPPVAEKPLLDIVCGEITALEDTTLQENHGCMMVNRPCMQVLYPHIPAAM